LSERSREKTDGDFKVEGSDVQDDIQLYKINQKVSPLTMKGVCRFSY
jgi:hypothetical protein